MLTARRGAGAWHEQKSRPTYRVRTRAYPAAHPSRAGRSHLQTYIWSQQSRDAAKPDDVARPVAKTYVVPELLLLTRTLVAIGPVSPMSSL
jgi:hypothetical protein